MGYLFPFFNFSSQLKKRFFDKLIRDPNTFYGCYYVTANNILEKEFHALRLISCLIFHFLFSMNNLKRWRGDKKTQLFWIKSYTNTLHGIGIGLPDPGIQYYSLNTPTPPHRGKNLEPSMDILWGFKAHSFWKQGWGGGSKQVMVLFWRTWYVTLKQLNLCVFLTE